MSYRILEGDARERLRHLPDESVQTCITSPPYWGLRDYGSDGQLGLEPTPEAYVANLVAVFREVRRVLRDDGTLWLNLGDSYVSNAPGRAGAFGRGSDTPTLQREGIEGRVSRVAGLKPKDLVGIPWAVAFALRADGWYLRSDIIWAKPNPMPESVTDRPTKSHEYLFLLSKAARYFYDAEAIKDPSDGRTHHDLTGPGYAAPGQTRQNGNRKQDGIGEQQARAGRGDRSSGFNERYFGKEAPTTRNKRSVWTVATQPFPGAHFATFPPKLIEPCVLAGAAPGDTVLDPFAGAGTTGVVALRHDRDFIGIELNPEYARMARNRIHDDAPLLNVEAA